MNPNQLADRFDKAVDARAQAAVADGSALMLWGVKLAGEIEAVELDLPHAAAPHHKTLGAVLDLAEGLRGYIGEKTGVTVTDGMLLEALEKMGTAERVVAAARFRAREADRKHSERVKASPSFGRPLPEPASDTSHLLGAEINRQLAQNRARGLPPEERLRGLSKEDLERLRALLDRDAPKRN